MKQTALFSGWELRTRLLAALVWLVGLLLLRHIASAWVLSGMLVLLMGLDRGISLKQAGHHIFHALPFLVLMALTLSLSDGLPPSQEALEFAMLLCSRVITAILVVLVLIGGRPAEDFIRALAVLPIPPTYLSLLFLTNRYVALFVREFRQQRLAMKARMFVPKANPRVLKHTGYVVGGLFIRGFDRSEQVYAAMRARCYTGVIPYETARPPKVLDILKLILSVLCLVGVLLLEIQMERRF